jgi:hypothetical protein
MANQSGRRGGPRRPTSSGRQPWRSWLSTSTSWSKVEREGDDDRWDDIAGEGVEVVVGQGQLGAVLGNDGWNASRPTYKSEIGSAAFGEGGLIGTTPARCKSGG